MKIKIDKKMFHEIEDVTNTLYYYENGFTNVETIKFIVGDLLDEIKELKNKIQHLENDINDNYRPVPVAEQVAISDNDFI